MTMSCTSIGSRNNLDCTSIVKDIWNKPLAEKTQMLYHQLHPVAVCYSHHFGIAVGNLHVCAFQKKSWRSPGIHSKIKTDYSGNRTTSTQMGEQNIHETLFILNSDISNQNFIHNSHSQHVLISKLPVSGVDERLLYLVPPALPHKLQQENHFMTITSKGNKFRKSYFSRRTYQHLHQRSTGASGLPMEKVEEAVPNEK